MSEQNKPMITVDAQALAFAINKLEVWAAIAAKAGAGNAEWLLAQSVILEATADLKNMGVPMIAYLSQTSDALNYQAADYFLRSKEKALEEAAAKQEPAA